MLKLALFGPVGVLRNGRPVSGLQQREGARILAYLALQRGHDVSYRRLTELFWPSEIDVSGAGDSPSVRRALYSLRKSLAEHEACLERPQKGVVRLNVDLIDIDLYRFDRLYESGSPDDWQSALTLCERPLMEGWDEPWAVKRRKRCAEMENELKARLASAGRAGSTPPPVQSHPAGTPYTSLRLRPGGGALPTNSHFYVMREADSLVAAAIEKRRSAISIRGPRRVGKSSLLARGLERARRHGALVLITDFGAIPANALAEAEPFFRTVMVLLALGIGGSFDTQSDWREHAGPALNLERFLSRRILTEDRPWVIWALDEVEKIRDAPFATDLFSLIRSWHNRRAMDPAGPWGRLTTVTCMTDEPCEWEVYDENQAPIGVEVRLAGFTLDEVAQLNRLCGSPLTVPDEIEQCWLTLKGQPYNTHLFLNALINRRPPPS